MKAQVRLDHQLLAVGTDQTVHAMLELTAPAAAPSARRPLNLALVIDRSGSMMGPKLETIEEIGKMLATHFHRGSTSSYELPDKIAER